MAAPQRRPSVLNSNRQWALWHLAQAENMLPRMYQPGSPLPMEVTYHLQAAQARATLAVADEKRGPLEWTPTVWQDSDSKLAEPDEKEGEDDAS